LRIDQAQRIRERHGRLDVPAGSAAGYHDAAHLSTSLSLTLVGAGARHGGRRRRVAGPVAAGRRQPA